MEATLESILSKLSSYNIFTTLIPGTFIAFVLKKLDVYAFTSDSAFADLVIFYFLGLVASRIGSLALDPLFIRCGIITRDDYSRYISASQKDQKIDTLLETSNLYRSLCAALLIVLITYCIKLAAEMFQLTTRSIEIGAVTLLLFLFVLAYRKQSKYILERIEHHKREV
jgi:hypothetical protein